VHGLIVHEFQRYVEAGSGPEASDEICDAIGLPRVADISGNYPDSQFVEAVLLAASRSRKPLSDVLHDFGEWLVPPLLSVYGVFVEARWNLFDVLEHTEATMHRAVRLRDPSALPPTLSVERVGPQEVRIAYRSERRLCALAKGIVAGLATHYETPIDLTESTCMHRGDGACTLSVVAVVPADPVPG
jgi:predicted hydrocarbon binding protein